MPAPGVRGMVMIVFTLPSFPFVFKVIRDHFEPPKDVDRQKVKDQYVLVKHHDRVGRMADTLEYSNVAFPSSRFDPTLLRELEASAPSQLERDGERLIIRHLYIERRLTPLDLDVRSADDAKLGAVMREYGNALADLAGATSFPEEPAAEELRRQSLRSGRFLRLRRDRPAQGLRVPSAPHPARRRRRVASPASPGISLGLGTSSP